MKADCASLNTGAFSSGGCQAKRIDEDFVAVAVAAMSWKTVKY
jgi:hypothetical protein